MRKYFVMSLCLFIMVYIIFFVVDKYKGEKGGSQYTLSEHQERVIKLARMSNKSLSEKDIDRFTIGQGKRLLDQYLKKHDLHYKVGSKKYIQFLAEISENRKLQKDPEFTIIGAYADIYLSELQKEGPTFFHYHLKQSTLDKTIKKIRDENNY